MVEIILLIAILIVLVIHDVRMGVYLADIEAKIDWNDEQLNSKD